MGLNPACIIQQFIKTLSENFKRAGVVAQCKALGSISSTTKKRVDERGCGAEDQTRDLCMLAKGSTIKLHPRPESLKT